MGAFDQDGASGNVQPVVIDVGGQLAQIFPIEYTQKNHCTMLGSPSEKGIIQYDNKVMLPSTVQFTGIVKYSQRKVIPYIRKFMKSINLGKVLCHFQSKGGSIQNMIIESFEEIGNSNRYDGIEVRVIMQEYLEHNVVNTEQ